MCISSIVKWHGFALSADLWGGLFFFEEIANEFMPNSGVVQCYS